MTQINFFDAMQQVSDDDAKLIASEIALSVDLRASYEHAKNSENDSIQKHLKSARAKLATSSVARFFIAANVKSTYVNEQERVNARRNVYAVLKLADLAQSVCFSREHNAITRACIKTLFAFADNDLTFTHKDALSCASNKVTVSEASKRKHMTRHTVAASTASTQASSSMSALIAANVVSESRTESNETSYALRDNALVSALRASLAS